MNRAGRIKNKVLHERLSGCATCHYEDHIRCNGKGKSLETDKKKGTFGHGKQVDFQRDQACTMNTREHTAHLFSLIDPRARLFVCFAFCAQLVFIDSIEGLIASFVPIFGATLLIGIPLSRLILAARKLRWFILVIVGINLFTIDGVVLFRLGSFIATTEGLVRGSVFSARLVLLLWCSMLVVWTTSPAKILEAIETWVHPLRRRFGGFIMMLTITFNLVPLFIEMAHRVGLSFRARGIDIDSGPLRRLKYLSSAATPLFTASSRMSEHLAVAMESRCYDPSANRTSYVSLKFRAVDWGFAGATLLLIGVNAALWP